MTYRFHPLFAAACCAALTLTACGGEKKAAPPAPAAAKEDLSKSLSVFANPVPPAPAINPTATVATVNGKAVQGSDLEKQVQALQMQASRRMPPEQLALILPRLQQQAVANLVNEQLLKQAATEHKIVVSDEELKKAKEDVMKGAPTGQTLEAALKDANLTVAQFEAQMRDGLSVRKLMEEQVSKATVSDADVKEFYEKNPDQFKRPETASARHILVMAEAGADEAKKTEAKKKAEAARERLLKGEDFAKVCAEVSEDPGSKDKGGLYENFPRGQMVPPFENAAFTQKPGEIGPLVETQFGFHIIKVEKRSEAGAVDFAEVQERLKAFLENQKKQEVAQKYLTGLRDAAKITYGAGFEPPAEAKAPAAPPAPAAK